MTPAIMPKVWGAALGMPVEPEVNRYLATVSWFRVSRAAATAGPGTVSVRTESGMAPSPVPSAVTKVRSRPRPFKVSRARAYISPDWAKITLGFTTSTQCLSLAWSVEIRL